MKKARARKTTTKQLTRNAQWVAFSQFLIEQNFKYAGKAYAKAYPKCRSGQDQCASKLLKNNKFQKLFTELIDETLAYDKLTLERRIIDVYLKRAFFDTTEIIGLDGDIRISEEELRKRGLDICIDGHDIAVDKYGAEHQKIILANRDKALQVLTNYVIKPQAQRIEHTGKDGKDLPEPVTQVFVMKKESLESWNKIMFGGPNPDRPTPSPAMPSNSSSAARKEAGKATSSSATIFKTTKSGVKRGEESSSAAPIPNSKKLSRARRKSTAK